MSVAFYQSSIIDFKKQNNEEIFGILTSNDKYDSSVKQKDAWGSQIKILKDAFINTNYDYDSILFEYTLPRVGGRIDNVLLIKNTIFVLEFKVGADKFNSDAIRQVRTYAFDLKNYHEESHNHKIIPILIATNADINSNKSVTDIICTNGSNLYDIISENIDNNTLQIDLKKWVNSRYLPTPSIIEAAKLLYNKHFVSEISQNSAAENLTKTYDAAQKIIDTSEKNHKKSICFITGVPGAGKTLAGLNIAINNQKKTEQIYSCFLTGNQPLFSVLSEALALDDNKKNGTQLEYARDKVKSFIQMIHYFRDEALIDTTKPPVDHVVIFDEAQRAWTQKQLSKFMKAKKINVLNSLTEEQRLHFLSMSEPEILIEYMNRHEDWAVIVCLVGGGQDINTGEAGIQEWFESIRHSFPDWDVYFSDKIKTEEYLEDKSFFEITCGLKSNIIPDLHLSVSIRSHRTAEVASFINALLDNDVKLASEKYKNLSGLYPIYISRNLNKAKQWVIEQTEHNKELRHGLIASSTGRRLRADGIWVEYKCRPEKWFLNGRKDIKSSYFMEEAATEFDVQGLEIDYAIIAWDADYRYVDGKFEYFKPRGSNWEKINQWDDKRYLKNAYRVLLTRAREGFVIFVPNGDDTDDTRLCKFYDELWQYLKKIGIDEL